MRLCAGDSISSRIKQRIDKTVALPDCDVGLYVPVANAWAYFRKLSGKELKTGITAQTNETVLFRIIYRADINTTHVIWHKGVWYDITQVDIFEWYKANLTIYAKAQ